MIKLYTTSKNRKCAEKILNSYAVMYPEYEPFLKMLGEFPAQKWAEKVRNRVNIDLSAIDMAILEDSKFFGISINCDVTLSYHQSTLRTTSEIIDIFNERLKRLKVTDTQRKVINNIFFSDDTISKYYVQKELPDVLEIICKRIMPFVMREYKKIQKKIDKIDDDTLVVFHDAEILFKLAKSFNAYSKKKNGIYRRDIHYIFEDIIDETKSYPFIDDIYTPLCAIYYGESIHKVCLNTRKHNDYVKKRYKEGIEVLNMIVWGYIKR